jgi:tetratricopeptide (TPR) repeat protein
VKKTIILKNKKQEEKLILPSDIAAIEIIPYEEYIDIVEPFKQIIERFAQQKAIVGESDSISTSLVQLEVGFKNEMNKVIDELKNCIQQADLNRVLLIRETKVIPLDLEKKINSLEAKLEEVVNLAYITDAKTAILRGNFFQNQGLFNKAFASYDWACHLEPNSHLPLLSRGNIFYLLENYHEAFKDYDKAVQINPNNFFCLFNRATANIRLKQYQKAIIDFNKALEIEPEDAQALCNRAIAYYKLHNFKQSSDDILHSLSIKPSHPRILYNYACLLSVWGKTNEALKYLTEAIEIDVSYVKYAIDDHDFDNIKNEPEFQNIIVSNK